MSQAEGPYGLYPIAIRINSHCSSNWFTLALRFLPEAERKADRREVIKVLQSAAELVPVPLLKDALDVAIKIIEVCEVSTWIVYERKAN